MPYFQKIQLNGSAQTEWKGIYCKNPFYLCERMHNSICRCTWITGVQINIFFSPRLPRVRLVQPGRPISIYKNSVTVEAHQHQMRCGPFWWLAVFNLARTFHVQNQPPQATPCDALCFEEHLPTTDAHTNATLAELWNFIRTWYFRMIWLRNKVRRSWKKHQLR